MLTEDEKKLIEDFIFDKTDVNPQNKFNGERLKEALKYAQFISNKEKLRIHNKIAKRILENIEE